MPEDYLKLKKHFIEKTGFYGLSPDYWDRLVELSGKVMSAVERKDWKNRAEFAAFELESEELNSLETGSMRCALYLAERDWDVDRAIKDWVEHPEYNPWK